MAEGETRLGCDHYRRRCKLVTPCCGKVYTCRFCHDENEDHTVLRKEVSQVMCIVCETKQPIQQTCINCSSVFGKFYCAICKLIDDDDKKQYHCDGCGICRVGGRDKFFHCERCDMCLPRKLQEGHKCVEKMSRINCPICMEDIHTSRIPSHIPKCGHLIHRTCFDEMVRGGHYVCPVCQTSLLNMERVWEAYDMEIAATPMPPEYQNWYHSILCRDCHQDSEVKYHLLGAKCAHCGSYNTCTTDGPRAREVSPSLPVAEDDTRPETNAESNNEEENSETC